MANKSVIHTSEVESFYDAFTKQGTHALITDIAHHFDELLTIVKTLRNRYEKLSDAVVSETDRISYLRDYHTGIFDLLTKYQQSVKDYQPDDQFADYQSLLEENSRALPSTLKRREIFTVYKIHLSVPVSQTLRKVIRNTGYYLHQSYLFAINVFRKVGKRPALETNIYLTRKIPFRNMAVYYLGVDIIPELTGILESFMEVKSRALEKLWKFNEKTEGILEDLVTAENRENGPESLKTGEAKEIFGSVHSEISEAKAEMKIRTGLVLQKAFEKFDRAAAIANTPDLSVKQFLSAGLKLQKKVGVSRQAQVVERWKNTHTTLFDDWIVDVEVVLLYYAVLADYGNLRVKIEKFVSASLLQNLDELIGFINASAGRIEKESVSVKKVSASLKNERNTVNEDLIDKRLTGTISMLSGNFLEDIEKFRERALKLADRVSEKRGFVRGGNYNHGIRSGEINYLSPRELLNFEAIPQFEEAVGEVRLKVENALEKARLKLISSGTVCDFSLESALMLVEQKKGYKAAWHVAEEGYQRAIRNIEEAREAILNISEEPLDELNEAVHDFNARIQKLKNSDNMLELNLQIARIRAVDHSRKARREAVQLVKDFIPASVTYLKTKAAQTSEMVDSVKTKMGMGGAKIGISYEVSEFIGRAESSLKKLPFVYQRLYQLNPTDEERFFVNRKNELNLLAETYDDWLKERFVTTAVIGEKGSGITSLLSYFVHTIESDMPLNHFTVEKKIYQPQNYFNFFAGIFEQDHFSSNEEIISFLNQQHEKRILIIENLQHFFLKKVNGLGCQRMLFDLIANTAKKVFWIGSYTVHSWDYLDRVIQVSDHFIREIRLQPMDSTSLEEIIYKRNNLSGYKVKFEPVDGAVEPRSFNRMDEKGQQEALRRQFFNELTIRSSGNVSLSQLYWLHSTRSVTEDSITIGSSFEIDLSFIREIKAEYLFALHTLLIHDGLTLEAYASIFNLPESECRNILVPMMEKGLLIRPREKFNVNPIIFRQVVNLLRSRNFIS